MTTSRRAAIYARVSTLDQEPENQLAELRRYVLARGWTATEYVDHGVSGAKEKRPALDTLVKDAKRRKVDVLVCWRLGRSARLTATTIGGTARCSSMWVRGSEATRNSPKGTRPSSSTKRLVALCASSGAWWKRPIPR